MIVRTIKRPNILPFMYEFRYFAQTRRVANERRYTKRRFARFVRRDAIRQINSEMEYTDNER